MVVNLKEGIISPLKSVRRGKGREVMERKWDRKERKKGL